MTFPRATHFLSYQQRVARARQRAKGGTEMKVISYSGGVQSTALLVLAANRAIHADCAIFVDLGAAESPDTTRYVYDVAAPFCKANAIKLHVAYYDALGDLYSNPAHPKAPFRSLNGGFSTRQCANHWKIRPFRRLLRFLMKERGIKVRKRSVEVILGISYDEIERMSQPDVAYYAHEYPLIELKMTREDCISVIQNAGLPIPEKSACWFCPYTSSDRIRSIARRHPDVERELIKLEATINVARARARLPLLEISRTVVTEEEAPCNGHCMT